MPSLWLSTAPNVVKEKSNKGICDKSPGKYLEWHLKQKDSYSNKAWSYSKCLVTNEEVMRRGGKIQSRSHIKICRGQQLMKTLELVLSLGKTVFEHNEELKGQVPCSCSYLFCVP